MFVTRINVSMESTASQMAATGSNAREASVIATWHAVQSFVLEEVMPDQCHEIGGKLAESEVVS